MQQLRFLRTVFVHLLFVLSFSFLSSEVTAQTATAPSGSGTSGDPYQIATLDNLYWLSQTTTVWDDNAYFIQTADIDASSSSSWANGSGFSPIGNSTTSFNGSYDGDNYQISNLFINRSTEDEIGFFGRIQNSTITDIQLEDVDVTGQNTTGSLVGYVIGSDEISTSSSSGSVSGSNRVGGLFGDIGSENASISHIHSSVSVSGNERIGGLVGAFYGSISDCYATGDVHGTSDIGGIIGTGDESPSLFRCYATGDVSGTDNVGGLIGRSGDNVAINNSYSTGKVSGSDGVGGFAGSIPRSSFVNSFSISKVSGSTNVGALIGSTSNLGTVSGSYWSSDLSSQSAAVGTIANTSFIDLSIAQMIDSTNFSGFDFASDTVWAIDQGFTFPYLIDLGDYRMVVATIDSGEGWRMIGNPGDVTYSELLDPIFTQGYEGSDGGTGFSSNVYFYEEPTQAWTAPSKASDYFGKADSNSANTALNGILLYVYGDDDGDGNEDSWPKYLISENTSISESFEVSLGYTDNVSSDSTGWNLVSNPYPVSLDWTEVVTNNDITNTFPVAYIWDDSLNAGAGAYRINYGYPLPPGLPQDLIFDGPIPAMQAFWVKATATGASLEFKPSYQGASQVLYKSQPDSDKAPLDDVPWISFTVAHEDFSDQVSLFGGTDKTPVINIPKLNTIASNYVEFSIANDDMEWISRSLEQTDQEIQLTLRSTETGSFILRWEGMEHFGSDLEFILVDNHTGESVNLHVGSEYEFEVSSEKTPHTQERFTLKITAGTISTNEPNSGLPTVVGLDQNYPNPFNPSTNINFQLPETGNVELFVFDILGRKVATLVDKRLQAGYHQVRFDARLLASGMYIYQLRTSEATITKKLTLIK